MIIRWRFDVSYLLWISKKILVIVLCFQILEVAWCINHVYCFRLKVEITARNIAEWECDARWLKRFSIAIFPEVACFRSCIRLRRIACSTKKKDFSCWKNCILLVKTGNWTKALDRYALYLMGVIQIKEQQLRKFPINHISNLIIFYC